jgi:uncharacterized protein involved in exopolysaccharide biosynthesis
MAEPVEIFRYIGYLRSRWRWIAGSCAAAVCIAALITALATRQYTATARILVEPPAGTDLRSAMAVSPIYLESLKTYEHFAEGDTLFQKALDKFNLHYTQPIESVKKRVLKVGLVRNTRILEISATMPDARAAQAMAQFVAESTVDLTRAVVSEGDRDLLGGMEQQQRDAQRRVEETEAAWAKTLAAEPVSELQSQMESAAEVRATIQGELANAELFLADAADREKQAQGGELAEIRRETGNTRARVAEMRKQIAQIDEAQAARERALSARQVHRAKLEGDRKSRQADLTASETRLREARADTGYRGERLKVIDPGIVPQRPSYPNVMLNLLAALLMGLVLPLLFLTIEMNYQEQRLKGRRSTYEIER